jgi:aspartyl-tRNA(Asn)/glutamyl-tRNA(Gln) amidotransferase subunit C
MKGEAGLRAEPAESSAEDSDVIKDRWRFGAKRPMINDQDVSHVADLANLELTSDERQRMVRDLSSILGYIDRLNELDTANVPPMAQIFGTSVLGINASGTDVSGISDGGRPAAWREDSPRPSLPHDAALKNAPAANQDFFKVPKVIEK